MNSFTRLAGYSTLLLLAFFATAFAARGWLQGQTLQLRTEAITAKRQQLLAAIALTRPAASGWNANYLHNLGEVIGGTVELQPDEAAHPDQDATSLSFSETVNEAAQSPLLLHVTFATPAMTRLLGLHQRMVLGLGLLAATLLCIFFTLILIPQRSGAERATALPWASAQAEMSGLTQLAKTSAAQSEELGRERDVRRRAEEDVQLKQRLLAQSLEEKIRLGHDLHDGIIQSLYAVGLTLESVRALAASNPAEADARLEKCRQSLNDTIRSVREYITGLTPENLRRIGFARALDSLIAELPGDKAVKFQVRVDDEAAALLSVEQGANALQIAREAISNSLRHSHANSITVRLHQAGEEICLLVQDNGIGFEEAQPGEGHGLRNMRARVERLGGVARLESQRGTGTRIIITLPVLQTL
jgi:signal transduction histidine kinase